jgi:hypothetical protein
VDTTITAAILAGRLNKKPDDPEVARCLAVAVAVVDCIVESAYRPVPQEIYDDCVVRAGRAVFDSTGRGAGGVPQGTQVGTEGGVRPPRDPKVAVRSLLVPDYVLEGLA